MYLRKYGLAVGLLTLTGLMNEVALAEGGHAAPSAAATGQGSDSSAADRYTLGEIRKVDTVQGKLTIRHGDIKNLGMPGMTMNFKVKDAAMLGQVQVGDPVRFVVERENGMLVITELHKAGK
jgi:Cu/Ag efflux protein CusF